MKKLLALALAAILLLSAIPFAGAAFKDQADVSFMTREAVEIMSDLKVVSGFPDGSFKPKDTLTRAQAAKILCCVALGTKAADALSATGSTFTDVPASHWSNKFVEYCASKGIVAGVGNGKFNPDGKLTGFAFGKMLLVALGADASQLTGANWDRNTQSLLKEKHLDYGVSPSNNELNRQDACRMALNAIFNGEAEDPEATLAFKSFGVVRSDAGVDKSLYMRPLVKYTSTEDSAYWEGVEKQIVASPVLYKQSGAMKGSDIIKKLGIEDRTISSFKAYRNGVEGVFKDEKNNHLKADDTANYYLCGNGVRLEFYYAADIDMLRIIHLFYYPAQIKEVEEAAYYSDGTLMTPGSVTFENGWKCASNEFKQSDVGNYACVYVHGDHSMNKPKEAKEAFRGKIVEGVITSIDAKKGAVVGGKTYNWPAYLGSDAEAKKYQANGGEMGDKVKVLLSDDNYVIMIWKAD